MSFDFGCLLLLEFNLIEFGYFNLGLDWIWCLLVICLFVWFCLRNVFVFYLDLFWFGLVCMFGVLSFVFTYCLVFVYCLLLDILRFGFAFLFVYFDYCWLFDLWIGCLACNCFCCCVVFVCLLIIALFVRFVCVCDCNGLFNLDSVFVGFVGLRLCFAFCVICLFLLAYV